MFRSLLSERISSGRFLSQLSLQLSSVRLVIRLTSGGREHSLFLARSRTVSCKGIAVSALCKAGKNGRHRPVGVVLWRGSAGEGHLAEHKGSIDLDVRHQKLIVDRFGPEV